MPKLTLSVDDEVIARAKRYARARGTSVSRLVQTFLGGLSSAGEPEAELGPVTRSLYGVLKDARASRKDYRDHLARKYR
jgi:hypothetical protein